MEKLAFPNLHLRWTLLISLQLRTWKAPYFAQSFTHGLYKQIHHQIILVRQKRRIVPYSLSSFNNIIFCITAIRHNDTSLHLCTRHCTMYSSINARLYVSSNLHRRECTFGGYIIHVFYLQSLMGWVINICIGV